MAAAPVDTTESEDEKGYFATLGLTFRADQKAIGTAYKK